jgi:hypothetical protein
MTPRPDVAGRAARLQAHIEAVSGVPVAWGLSDCSAWAARWVAAESGRRLPLPAYAEEAEARALIAGAGGLTALWCGIAARAGLGETACPALGDVGVLQTGAYGEVGVIFAADGLCALRTPAGVTFLRPRRILRAWTI